MSKAATRWATRLAVTSVACSVFVALTIVVRGSSDWSKALGAVWSTALLVSVVASLAAPLAAFRSSLGPKGRAVVVVCSLPAFVLLGLLLYILIVVVPELA